MCSEIGEIITFLTDAYDLKPYVKIKTEEQENKLAICQLIIELKPLSPYVDNFVRLNIQYSKNRYIISLVTESLHDSMIGSHILSNVLNTFESNPNVLSENIDKLNRNNMIIVQKTDSDQFIECLIRDVDKNFASYHRICPSCFTIKPIDTLIITPCDKCIPLSFNKIYSNIVTDLYDKDINQFKLLLYTTLKAIDNKQRFVPVPRYCVSNQYEDSELNPSQISRDFSYYLDNVSVSSDDKDLFGRIKEKEYMFLKHIIVSNNTRLNYFDDSKQSVVDKTIDLWSTASKTNKSIVFTVSHPLEKQVKFDSSPDVVHMFHGSSIYNWYSIMRNGLKNYSGTAMMSNGQAYGPGIYLATNIGMAMGYCRTGTDEHNIIGVVQVLNSSKYKKNDQIYVVPEEADVLLKYLIVIKSKRDTSDITKIQDYLTKELPETIKGSLNGSIGITMKRLNKEYEELTKRIKKLNKTKTQNLDLTNHITDVDVDVDRSDNIQDKNDCLVIRWRITLNYIKILDNKKSTARNIVIDVIFPRAFPSSSCIITCNNPCVASVPMMELNSLSDNVGYTYTDPLMRYDKWRSDIKIFKILEQMMLNIVEFSS